MLKFEKISFQRWLRDVPIKNLDVRTAMRWHHNIKMPKVDSNGQVVFYAPYNVLLIPNGKVCIPTGMMIAGADEKWGHIRLFFKNPSIKPIFIYAGQPLSMKKLNIDEMKKKAELKEKNEVKS